MNDLNRTKTLEIVKSSPGIKSHELAGLCGWNPFYARNMLNWLAERREAKFKWKNGSKSWYPTN